MPGAPHPLTGLERDAAQPAKEAHGVEAQRGGHVAQHDEHCERVRVVCVCVVCACRRWVVGARCEAGARPQRARPLVHPPLRHPCPPAQARLPCTHAQAGRQAPKQAGKRPPVMGIHEVKGCSALYSRLGRMKMYWNQAAPTASAAAHQGERVVGWGRGGEGWGEQGRGGAGRRCAATKQAGAGAPAGAASERASTPRRAAGARTGDDGSLDGAASCWLHCFQLLKQLLTPGECQRVLRGVRVCVCVCVCELREGTQ